MTGLFDIHQGRVHDPRVKEPAEEESEAMTKLRSVGRNTSEDLRARVHFCAETGQIWLHEHRMLLVHAEAQATCCARN
jgi:fructose-1,6-bisphosphatase